MQKLSKKQFFTIALMLFSMFFGAGNFIFPPMVGRDAGTNYYIAIMFFCATAVLLPVLGVAAIARAGTLKKLASRADGWFAGLFVMLIYLSIGPFLAIPRAGNMPFEISIMQFLDPEKKTFYLAIYGAIYFALNLYVCIYPSKMVELLGKYLTPVMLILIVVFFVVGFLNPMGEFSAPNGDYAAHPVSKGFIEGYQTMDALAALVFGIIIAGAMRERGVKDEEHLAISTIKAGMFAGAILMIVYVMLGYLGATSATLFGSAENGAELLSLISNHLFGKAGVVVLGVAFFLACFTTTTGLISSVSAYFEEICPKISYKKWVLIWVIVSYGVANLGLDRILKFSIPVLIAIYPVAIVLVILSLINKIVDSSRIVYRVCVYVAAFVGVVNALDIAGFKIPFVTENIAKLPFYESMLGWIVPVAIGFVVSYIFYLAIQKKDNY